MPSRVALRVLGVVLGVALLSVGAVFGGIPLFNEYQKYQQVETARPVNATVVDTSISRRVDDDLRVREVRYTVRVTYRYAVDGETYTSRNVVPPGAGGAGAVVADTRAEAENVTAAYDAGDVVTAHVVAGDPSVAFLRPRRPGPLSLLLPLGLALFPLSLGAVALATGAGVLDPSTTAWWRRLVGVLATLLPLLPVGTGVGVGLAVAEPWWADGLIVAGGLVAVALLLRRTAPMVLFGRRWGG
ncbi:DUF3592 domain-containing protein [Haloplanus halophilus]|uniref:DUF3592 domain-containing protein n=1 Tax=Haloplanus halophilus TaxID=2949993 RepID=UPI00203C508E|nr:DUF3592 domain-containing protein [Haloplanus sp. GDY1]